MPNDLHKRLETHLESDEMVYASILSDIRIIRENHLAHMETDIKNLMKDFVKLQVDIGWVKWGLLAILGGIISVFFK